MASTSTGVGSSVTETTQQTEQTTTLKLKLKKKKQTKKIRWTEDTVDNEGRRDILFIVDCVTPHTFARAGQEEEQVLLSVHAPSHPPGPELQRGGGGGSLLSGALTAQPCRWDCWVPTSQTPTVAGRRTVNLGTTLPIIVTVRTHLWPLMTQAVMRTRVSNLESSTHKRPTKKPKNPFPTPS